MEKIREIIEDDDLRRVYIDRLYNTEMTDENIALLIDVYVECRSISIDAFVERRTLKSPSDSERKKELNRVMDQAGNIGDLILDIFYDQLSDERCDRVCSIIKDRVDKLYSSYEKKTIRKWQKHI